MTMEKTLVDTPLGPVAVRHAERETDTATILLHGAAGSWTTWSTAIAAAHRVARASTIVLTHCGSGRPGRAGSNRGLRHASATTANVNVSAHAAPISAYV